METCTVETGLLRKAPCGGNAVAKCANCEQPLCTKHAVAQLNAAGKKTGTFLCPPCNAAQRDIAKTEAKAAGAVKPAALPPKPAAVPPKPAAPVYLLHGSDDNVIPSEESLLLAGDLREHTHVRLLVTDLLSHVTLDRPARVADLVRLIALWRDLFRQR